MRHCDEYCSETSTDWLRCVYELVTCLLKLGGESMPEGDHQRRRGGRTKLYVVVNLDVDERELVLLFHSCSKFQTPGHSATNFRHPGSLLVKQIHDVQGERKRDATVGVHKDFLRQELLVALYLVQNTNREIFESSPGFQSQYARDVSRMNLPTGML